MNIRKNARLTPQGRLLMVRRIEEQGWTVAAAALSRWVRITGYDTAIAEGGVAPAISSNRRTTRGASP